MRIFSLDTSFPFFNFSVVENGELRLLHYLDSSKKTLENLPKILSEQCIDLSKFDALAVSVGVGYLTSLRIGVTFMKTTAYTLKKPIVSFENLYLLGRFTPVPFPRVPFLRISANIFYRVFKEGKTSEVRMYKGEYVEGWGVSLERFKDAGLLERAHYHPFFPFSAYGGLYAYEFLKENPKGEDVFQIEPLYLKPPA